MSKRKPKRRKQRRWTLQERMELATAKNTDVATLKSKLDKAPTAIRRKIERNEKNTLREVIEIRKLWKSGVSMRRINKLYGRRVDKTILNLAFYDPEYNPKR